MYTVTVQQDGKPADTRHYPTQSEQAAGFALAIGQCETWGFTVRIVDTPRHVALRHSRYAHLSIDVTR